MINATSCDEELHVVRANFGDVEGSRHTSQRDMDLQDTFLYIIVPLHIILLVSIGTYLYRRAWRNKSVVSQYIIPANGCMPEHWIGHGIESYCYEQLNSSRPPGRPTNSLTVTEAFQRAGYPLGRQNGCHPPFQVEALFTFLIACYLLTSMCIVVLPAMPSGTERTIWIVLYAVLISVVLVCFLIVECHNVSTDELAMRSDNPILTGTKVPVRHQLCPFCSIIRGKATYYGCERRYHCNHCSRCTPGMDHHCWFLNSCISSNNYRSFLTLLVSYDVMLIVQICAGGRCLYYMSRGECNVDTAGDVAMWILLVMQQALCTLALAHPSYILGYHINLMKNGQTTIEFIQKTYQNEVARPLPNSLKNSAASSAQGALKVDTSEGAIEVSPVEDSPEKYNAAHVINAEAVSSVAMRQAGIITMGLVSPTHVHPSEIQLQGSPHGSASSSIVAGEAEVTVRI